MDLVQGTSRTHMDFMMRDVVFYPTLLTGDSHMDFMMRDVVSYPNLCTGDFHMDFMLIEMWYPTLLYVQGTTT